MGTNGRSYRDYGLHRRQAHIRVPVRGREHQGGTVVFASDNVYTYENLEKHVPITATLDAGSNLAAQDRMKKIASNPRLIIPGHDPEVFVRFPKPGNGVARLE